MIRARGTTSAGRAILILGLSWQNLTRLRAGDPIRFDATAMGFDGEVMIWAGRDETTMKAMVERDNPGVTLNLELGNSHE